MAGSVATDAPAQQRAWRIHTSIVRGGTVLQEFSGEDGSVFAVTWRGPMLPDFRAVLGDTYYALLESERRNAPKTGRVGMHVVQPEFVLESSGRAPLFAGKAWLPKRLPAGFVLERLP